MSLIRKIAEALKPLAPLGKDYDTHTYGPIKANSIPDLSYKQWSERLEHMDRLTKEHFTRDHYRRVAQIFTTSIPTDKNGKIIREDGKVIRYSDKIPDNIGELLDRLSYNSQDTLNVHVGKYIALLIGFREIRAMAKVPHYKTAIREGHIEEVRDLEMGDRVNQIRDTVKRKLQEFPFYTAKHLSLIHI